MTNGAGMAFMVAGAVSCIPAMTAVYALVRRPVFTAYVGLGFAGAVLSGYRLRSAVPDTLRRTRCPAYRSKPPNP